MVIALSAHGEFAQPSVIAVAASSTTPPDDCVQVNRRALHQRFAERLGATLTRLTRS